MSPGSLPTRQTRRRFPRVSGDEPQLAYARVEAGEFSPRERG